MRILNLLLILFLAVTISACGEKKKSNTAKNTTGALKVISDVIPNTIFLDLCKDNKSKETQFTIDILKNSVGTDNCDKANTSLYLMDQMRLTKTEIKDLTPFKSFMNIEVLYLLSNNISDLTPLESLTNLKELYLNGNPIPNPDAQLKKLQKALPNTKIFLTEATEPNPQKPQPPTATNDDDNHGTTVIQNQDETGNSTQGTTHQDNTVITGGSNTGTVKVYKCPGKLADQSKSFSKLCTDALAGKESTELTNTITAILNTTGSGKDCGKAETFLKSAKTFEIYDKDITDITPLKDFTQLEWLNLNNNKICDITPLKNLVNLKLLSLDNNQVIHVNALSSLKSLKFLYLNNNQIVNMGPINATGLKVIIKKMRKATPVEVAADDPSASSSAINNSGSSTGTNGQTSNGVVQGNNSQGTQTGTTVNNKAIKAFVKICKRKTTQLCGDRDQSCQNKKAQEKTIEALRKIGDLTDKQKTDCTALGKYIAQATSLTLMFRGLETLEPLNLFNHFEELYLLGNNLQDDKKGHGVSALLPLSGMKKLTTLFLNKNGIINLGPLSGLVNLETLHLAANNISDLSPLTKLNKLRNLNIDNNPMAKFTYTATSTRITEKVCPTIGDVSELIKKVCTTLKDYEQKATRYGEPYKTYISPLFE